MQEVSITYRHPGKCVYFFIQINLFGTVYDDTSLHIQALRAILPEYRNWILG